MTQELLNTLNRLNVVNLPKMISALEYFSEHAEFIYPLDSKDAWALEGMGGRGKAESKRARMDVLHMVGLVSKDKVPSVVPFHGNVAIYELNNDGKEMFEKLFNKSPRMCHSSHYARSH